MRFTLLSRSLQIWNPHLKMKNPLKHFISHGYHRIISEWKPSVMASWRHSDVIPIPDHVSNFRFRPTSTINLLTCNAISLFTKVLIFPIEWQRWRPRKYENFFPQPLSAWATLRRGLSTRMKFNDSFQSLSIRKSKMAAQMRNFRLLVKQLKSPFSRSFGTRNNHNLLVRDINGVVIQHKNLFATIACMELRVLSSHLHGSSGTRSYHVGRTLSMYTSKICLSCCSALSIELLWLLWEVFGSVVKFFVNIFKV